MTDTPTSANTAAHMLTRPTAQSTSTNSLTVSANTTFCFAIASVFLAISISCSSLDGSSVMMTTSAASMAASEPRPPMAIPTSALASTGASLIPSPTNKSLPFSDFAAMSFSTSSTLFSGSSSACTSSKPSALPTRSATALLSPVSITVLMPLAFKPRIAAAASSLI